MATQLFQSAPILEIQASWFRNQSFILNVWVEEQNTKTRPHLLSTTMNPKRVSGCRKSSSYIKHPGLGVWGGGKQAERKWAGNRMEAQEEGRTEWKSWVIVLNYEYLCKDEKSAIITYQPILQIPEIKWNASAHKEWTSKH